MKRKLFAVIVVIMCCLIWLGIGLLLGQQYEISRQAEPRIPSLVEIQKMIGAEPDGIWGIETKTKWDAAICNQYAAQYDYLYESEVK